MQKKKKKNKLFIFLIICFVLVPFLLTKGCNYIESLNQAKNSVSEPITSISEQIQPSASVYTHAHTPARTHSRSHNAGAYAHERTHTRVHNAHVYAQMHSISKANWTGTAVPNTGYVENVYVNTNLSNNEVFNIIENANLPLFEGAYYVIQGQSDVNNNITILNLEDIWFIAYEMYSDVLIWASSDFTEGGIAAGWNSYFSSPINFNDNSVSTTGNENDFVGTRNNLLTGLFSITPFEQSSNNELSIGNLFTQIGNAIIIFGGAVVNVFISMEPIFWNEGPTLIFILLIASVSFALVFWGIELLISLIGISRTKRKKKK